MEFCEILDELAQVNQDDARNPETLRQKIEKLLEIEQKFTTGLNDLKDYSKKRDEKAGDNELEVTQGMEPLSGRAPIRARHSSDSGVHPRPP